MSNEKQEPQRSRKGHSEIFEHWREINSFTTQEVLDGMCAVNDAIATAHRIAEGQFPVEQITPDLVLRIAQMVLQRWEGAKPPAKRPTGAES